MTYARMSQRYQFVALLLATACKAEAPQPYDVRFELEIKGLRVELNLNEMKSYRYPALTPGPQDSPEDLSFHDRFETADVPGQITLPWLVPGSNQISGKVTDIGDPGGKGHLVLRLGNHGSILHQRDLAPGDSSFEITFNVPEPELPCTEPGAEDDKEIRALVIDAMRAGRDGRWDEFDAYQARPNSASARLRRHSLARFVADLEGAGLRFSVPAQDDLALRRDCWTGGVWVERTGGRPIFGGHVPVPAGINTHGNLVWKARKFDDEWKLTYF